MITSTELLTAAGIGWAPPTDGNEEPVGVTLPAEAFELLARLAIEMEPR